MPTKMKSILAWLVTPYFLGYPFGRVGPPLLLRFAKGEAQQARQQRDEMSVPLESSIYDVHTMFGLF